MQSPRLDPFKEQRSEQICYRPGSKGGTEGKPNVSIMRAQRVRQESGVRDWRGWVSAMPRMSLQSMVTEVESIGFVEIFYEKRCHNYISEVNYWL